MGTNAAQVVETDRERFARLAKPFKRGWLAEQLGISDHVLRQRMCGRSGWRRLELVKLAEIFEVSVDYLTSVEDMAS